MILLRRQSLRVLSCVSLLLALVSSAGLSKEPRSAFIETVLDTDIDSSFNCQPTGLIKDATCDFESVESLNKNLLKYLDDIVKLPYFRYHRVNLNRECPFWQEDGSCMNRACGVDTTDEDHLPLKWRAQSLSDLVESRDIAYTDHENDFCVLEDALEAEGEYVDLIENPERFTGYAGPSANKVWRAIYEENCFSPLSYVDPSRSKEDGGSGFAPIHNPFDLTAKQGVDTQALFENIAAPRDGGDDMCLEKRVFYKLISGLHASISIHICDEYMNQTTGEWGPNLECFITRIGQHPERLQNVYFVYALLVRALEKTGPILQRTLQMTSPDLRDPTRQTLDNVIRSVQSCPSAFDESIMFTGPSADIKHEFRGHFMNISRIMDCVGCDKCRLWGKLQITGLGTALKLLFSEEDQTSDLTHLSRPELVAFINVLHRLSESITAIDKFRDLWQAERKKYAAATLRNETKIGGGQGAPRPARRLRRPKQRARPAKDIQPQHASYISYLIASSKMLINKIVSYCRHRWSNCFSSASKTEL